MRINCLIITMWWIDIHRYVPTYMHISEIYYSIVETFHEICLKTVAGKPQNVIKRYNSDVRVCSTPTTKPMTFNASHLHFVHVIFIWWDFIIEFSKIKILFHRTKCESYFNNGRLSEINVRNLSLNHVIKM